MKRDQTDFLKLCLADALIQLMGTQDYEAISVQAVCQLAGVGRTTFYRHLDPKNSKAELLLFKIDYEWRRYAELHSEDVEKDRGLALIRFLYENRQLFTLLHDQGLVAVVMEAVERLIGGGEHWDGGPSYLMAFFTYGYFGILYQWIRTGFRDTPEQITGYFQDAMSQAGQGQP